MSLPRPVLQQNRSAFDKLVDMIIGDGPSNRYALICKVCSSHNGMALKNEFEYLGNLVCTCDKMNMLLSKYLIILLYMLGLHSILSY